MVAKQHLSLRDKKASRSSIYYEPIARLGNITATYPDSGDLPIFHCDRSDVRVDKIILLVSSDTTSTAANYWQVQVTNRGSGGAGTDTLFATAPDTRAANDGDLSQYEAFELSPDQNQELTQGDVLSLKLTKNGSASNLDDLVVQLQLKQDL